MTEPKTYNFKEILQQFPLEGEVKEVKPIGNGHINDTYGVLLQDGKLHYVLQRINHQIFKDVEGLQSNIFIVTEHIKKKLEARGESDIERKVLQFLPTKDGKQYYYDGQNYWRVCLYIHNSSSYEEVSPALAEEAGRAFGDFQAMLADIPVGALKETIPNFHNMLFRLEQLREAVKNDACNRLEKVQEIVNELESRADDMCLQERLYQHGDLPKRTNHCDTKVNNILFDKDSKDVLAVVDLDTVMPGFVLSDIGDFIRTAVNTAAEDEADTDKIQLNLPVFQAYTRGYMERAKDFLSPQEIALLPYGGRLLTYMQTVRFLTDYLNGDVYYKTAFKEHNLQRAKAQFALLLKLEEHREEMDAFMQQWLSAEKQ